jgi:Mce-associated membrane protein
VSKDDKTPPENSADPKDSKDSKDPKDSKDTATGSAKDTGNPPSKRESEAASTSSSKEAKKSEASKKSKDSGHDVGENRENREDGGDASSAGGEGAKKRGGVPAWVAVLSVVILVIGVAGAVWQAIGYFQDRSDKNAAALRDEVIDVASQVVVNSLSFSADTIDEDQERLREGSTGEFLAQQDEYAEQIKQTVVDQGATTSAQISNSALSDIDEDTGTATVLLVYTAQSEREELPPVSGRQAARVELIREGDQWKVAELVAIGAQVPVGESSEGVQQLDNVTGGAGGGEDSDAGEGADAASESDADSGSGSASGDDGEDGDDDASPTSGAAATTAGGN